MTEIEKLLVDGRAKIERRWRQGIWTANNLGACMMDAIPVCPLWPERRTRAQDLLANAVGVRDSGDCPAWNDTPGRTKEEVLAAYDRAIEMARAP